MTTKSILIVDDDSAIRKYLSYTLNSAKYQVELATDGYEALAQARNSRYDLAIVDLVLPGEMNGMDIINSLKTISPDTRVIATSAYSGQAFSDKTTRAGADMFITKTLLSEQLISSVESLLGKPAINSNEFTTPAKPPFQTEVKPEDMIIPQEPKEEQATKQDFFEPGAMPPAPPAEAETDGFAPDRGFFSPDRVEESGNGTNHNGADTEDLGSFDESAENKTFTQDALTPVEEPPIVTEPDTDDVQADQAIMPTGTAEQTDNGTNHNGSEKTENIFKAAESPSHFQEEAFDQSDSEKPVKGSIFVPQKEQPFAQPTNNAAKAENSVFIPHILKKLPKDTIANILTLGRLIDVEEGKQVIVNYTGQVVIVRSGRAKCKYGNKYILTLDKGDAVGEECLLLDYDPQFRIIIEAEQALQLIIIPKDMLNDYFKKHDISFFIGFQLNVTLSLSKKLRQSFA